MRVAIIGAGISGLLSAYYLLEKGYEVEILESNGAVATKASGVNAAQLSYSYVNPIGNPSLLKMLPSVLLGKNKGIRLSNFKLSTLIWAFKLLRQSDAAHFYQNRSVLLEHSLKSRELFHQLLEKTDISLKYYSKGKLQLLHTEKLVEQAEQFIEVIQGTALSQMLMDRTGAEPFFEGMKLDEDQQHFVYSDVDETADCVDFCHALLEWLQQNERFKIHYNISVKQWHTEQNKVSFTTSNGTLRTADKILLCVGSYTNTLVKPLGLSFPILPVKGYTLVYDYASSLKCSVTDHKIKVVFVPQKERLLVSGMFHIGDGRDKDIDYATVEHIHQVASQRIPELKNASYEIKAGLRPCTPNSLPILKKLRYDNLYINSGHGMYGWTLASACAHQIAEAIIKSS